MSFKTVRKTFRIGQSRCVTLPPAWCTFYGDRIKTVTILGHNVLILAPEGLEGIAQKLIEEVETMGKK